MSTRYFSTSPASRVVETDSYTFRFEPTYRFLSAIVGTIAIDDPAQAAELSDVAATHGVNELTAEEYANAIQKKAL